jgi:hypothetical protein
MNCFVVCREVQILRKYTSINENYIAKEVESSLNPEMLAPLKNCFVFPSPEIIKDELLL